MNATQSSTVVPSEMAKGSAGIGVLILKILLQLAGLFKEDDQANVFDCKYDDRIVTLVATLQEMVGMAMTGVFDSATRARVKTVYNGFDFDGFCFIIGGTTVFVQADGSKITWWPGTAVKIAVPSMTEGQASHICGCPLWPNNKTQAELEAANSGIQSV